MFFLLPLQTLTFTFHNHLCSFWMHLVFVCLAEFISSPFDLMWSALWTWTMNIRQRNWLWWPIGIIFYSFFYLHNGEIDDMIERNSMNVTLHDVDPTALRQLIDYAYTGEITITEDNVQVYSNRFSIRPYWFFF